MSSTHYTKASALLWVRVLQHINLLQCGNSWFIRQTYKMLRHPVPGAHNIIVKKRTMATMTIATMTIATMTRGTKCYILLQYLHTAFSIITGLVVS